MKTPRKSFTTARVIYPKLEKAEVESRLREAALQASRIIPLQKVVLFGSYAKNRYTAASDIDVIAVYTGARRSDAYEALWRILHVPHLELQVFHEEDFSELLRQSPRFAQELKKGVQIYP